MNVTFQDMQQLDNPMNGRCFANAPEIASFFQSLAGRQPFLFELRGENGFMLTIGFANDRGSVQYCSNDGLPPYLMALSNDAEDEDGGVEFLAGNTPTPISQRFCLPMQRVEEIVQHFVMVGGRSDAVFWEEI